MVAERETLYQYCIQQNGLGKGRGPPWVFPPGGGSCSALGECLKAVGRWREGLLPVKCGRMGAWKQVMGRRGARVGPPVQASAGQQAER